MQRMIFLAAVALIALGVPGARAQTGQTQEQLKSEAGKKLCLAAQALGAIARQRQECLNCSAAPLPCPGLVQSGLKNGLPRKDIERLFAQSKNPITQEQLGGTWKLVLKLDGNKESGVYDVLGLKSYDRLSIAQGPMTLGYLLEDSDQESFVKYNVEDLKLTHAALRFTTDIANAYGESKGSHDCRLFNDGQMLCRVQYDNFSADMNSRSRSVEFAGYAREK